MPVPQDVWFHSFKQLQNYYKQQSRWKDLANMYCLTIEVSCVLPGLAHKVIDQPSHQRRIAKLEHDLGEALESLAKYEVAAEMYEEAASLFPAGAYERDHAIHDAGLARRRAYQCDRAEQLYHTALHSRVSHGDDVSTLFTWFKDLSAAPADYDPAPDGVASACHPAEPVSCGRYDGAVTKFGGWKGKRFAVV